MHRTTSHKTLPFKNSLIIEKMSLQINSTLQLHISLKICPGGNVRELVGFSFCHTEISFSFSVVCTHKIALVGVNPGRMQSLILVNKLLLYYV